MDPMADRQQQAGFQIFVRMLEEQRTITARS
jgi:hypothetical protein